jgi:hypothetical protein
MNGVKFRNRNDAYQSAYFRNAKIARERQDGEITNAEYAKTEGFQLKCMEAGVKPTKRQASRYRNGYGSLVK